MASSRQSWSPPPQPETPDQIRETWDRYRQTLANLPGSPTEQIVTLHGLLADVSARLELESRSLVSRTLSDYASERDRLTLRSAPTAPPSSPRSSSESSPQPGPADLLARTSRLGPRLAQKLIVASARAASRRR